MYSRHSRPPNSCRASCPLCPGKDDDGDGDGDDYDYDAVDHDDDDSHNEAADGDISDNYDDDIFITHRVYQVIHTEGISPHRQSAPVPGR